MDIHAGGANNKLVCYKEFNAWMSPMHTLRIQNA
jgi:hypothetical protein